MVERLAHARTRRLLDGAQKLPGERGEEATALPVRLPHLALRLAGRGPGSDRGEDRGDELFAALAGGQLHELVQAMREVEDDVVE